MNTIKIAENALNKHNSLKNVTIVSHSRVQCTADVDPLGLLDNLVIFANKYMMELWRSSTQKDKVFIGIQDRATYFESVLNILLSSFNGHPVHTKVNDHTSYPQSPFMKLNKVDRTICPQANYIKRNSRRAYSTVLAGKPFLKTSNRFSPLSQMQGSY